MDSKQESKKNAECPICMEALDHPDFNVIALECGHTFHLECLSESIKQGLDQKNDNKSCKRECPYCRSNIKMLLPRLPFEMPVKDVHADYDCFADTMISLNDISNLLLDDTKCLALVNTTYNRSKKVYAITHKTSQCKRKTKNNFCCIHSKKYNVEDKVFYFPK